MRSHYLYCLLLVISSVYAFSCAADQIDNNQQDLQSAPTTTILIYGDSLSAAYNIKQNEGWPTLLQEFVNQRQLNLTIVNASISGETTAGGLARISAELAAVNPQLVIIELGGNDGLRGFDLSTTRDNLKTMIALSIKQGAKVVLAGMRIPPNYGRTYTQRFEQIYQDLGRLDKVTLVPFILAEVATNSALMQADGIHPNADGQPYIVNAIWPFIAQALQIKVEVRE